MKCVVFRCSKKQGMYLYVPDQDDMDVFLKSLPDGLLILTGKLDKVMDLELTPDKKLAIANAADVLLALKENGFYLQSPPNAQLIKDTSMLNNPSDSF